MSDEDRIPAEVWPLAYFLCEEMEARKWTTTDVAVRMGGSAEAMALNSVIIDLLMCVQKDNMIIGDDLFAGLAKSFRVTEQLFRNLHETWLKWPDRRVPFDPPDHIFGARAVFSLPPSSHGATE